MKGLDIANNLVSLRHQKGITQGDLADFLGVTKASVSKWETGQSYPDILLIPQLATFFNISTDELLGYNPKLSPEQIEKYYIDICNDFVNCPYDEVIEKCKHLAKEYYSCYPFLYQIALLYINHFMLADTSEKGITVLNECCNLCNHIIDSCQDIPIREDAQILKALTCLQLEKPLETIEILKPLTDPKQLRSQADTMLIQAYQMTGNPDRADYYCQLNIYTHLLQFISCSVLLLTLHMSEPDYCIENIRRIEEVITTCKLESLHLNLCLQFYYHCSLFYASLKDKKQTLFYLNRFTKGGIALLNNDLMPHGDNYFTKIDEWFNSFGSDMHAPRAKKTVADSILQNIAHPTFTFIFEEKEYKDLKAELERKLSI